MSLPTPLLPYGATTSNTCALGVTSRIVVLTYQHLGDFILPRCSKPRGCFGQWLAHLVGRERLELPVFLVLRVYSPLPSPLGIPAHIYLLVVGRAGIEPAVPRLKVVCLTTRLPAHIFGGSSLIRTGNCEFCRLPSYRLTKEPDGTQSRSRTYVKGLEDPCTIRYTIRASVVGPLGFEPR